MDRFNDARQELNDYEGWIDDKDEWLSRCVNQAKEEYWDSEEWEEESEEVFEMDNHQCVTCGYKHSLVAHHITYSGYVHDIINERITNSKHPLFGRGMVTLCYRCHQKIHRACGRGFSVGGVKLLIRLVNEHLKFSRCGNCGYVNKRWFGLDECPTCGELLIDRTAFLRERVE